MAFTSITNKLGEWEKKLSFWLDELLKTVIKQVQQMWHRRAQQEHMQDDYMMKLPIHLCYILFHFNGLLVIYIFIDHFLDVGYLMVT